MDLEYSYRELLNLCNSSKLGNVSKGISNLFENNLAKKWTPELNSEWVCRHYLATKMILNATVLLKALEFSTEKNMRLANPYFEYYAVLSLARAIVYTLPTEYWNNGEIIMISHSKAIKLAFSWLGRFNSNIAKNLEETTLKLKAQRELIAYRIPSSGDLNLSDDHNLEEILTILAEVAQFNSELLYKALEKYADKKNFIICDDSHAREIADIEIEGFNFFDNEDAYRLGYLKRKMPSPYPLHFTMTEGMTEDFFSAWDSDSDDGQFSVGSPSSWQIIFDIP